VALPLDVVFLTNRQTIALVANLVAWTVQAVFAREPRPNTVLIFAYPCAGALIVEDAGEILVVQIRLDADDVSRLTPFMELLREARIYHPTFRAPSEA
jgi:hypothetical protein